MELTTEFFNSSFYNITPNLPDTPLHYDSSTEDKVIFIFIMILIGTCGGLQLLKCCLESAQIHSNIELRSRQRLHSINV